jgi:hypothetical protein
LSQQSFPKTHPKLSRFRQLVDLIESGNYLKDDEDEYIKLLTYLNSKLYTKSELKCPNCDSTELCLVNNVLECQSCGWLNE